MDWRLFAIAVLALANCFMSLYYHLYIRPQKGSTMLNDPTSHSHFPYINIYDKTIFYEDLLMPCCGHEVDFFNGPRCGFCTNIKCVHCGSKFNICLEMLFIERIV